LIPSGLSAPVCRQAGQAGLQPSISTPQGLTCCHGAAALGAKEDVSYDPAWQSAVSRTSGAWTVEAAIPKGALRIEDWPARVGFNIARNGPNVTAAAWGEEFASTEGSTLVFQGVPEPVRTAGAKAPAGRPARLNVTVERPSARPGERWIEADLLVQPGAAGLAELRLTAAVFKLGETAPAARATAVPERSRGRLLVDLRSLGLSRARLCVKLSRGEKLLDTAEVLLSTREAERPLQPGQKIAVKLDLPEGIEKVESWAVTFGVPFPAGALWDAERIRLVDGKGREIPHQKEVTGLWAKDGAVKWVRFDALLSSDGECFVEAAPAAEGSGPAAPVKVTEQAGKVVLDTGAARYVLARGPSPIEEVWLGERRIAAAGKRGLYVVDQKGRTASASAEGETMVVEASGPVAACVRFEGFYRTPSGEQLARHITRVEAFAGQPFAKVTHTLVLTNDTNEVWFRDIGWEFSVESGGGAKAVFGVSRSDWAKSLTRALDRAGAAYMLQDRHYRFAHGDNHFLVAAVARDGGTVLTKPLSLGGSRLFVNANAAYGWIKIALLDEQGNDIPGGRAVVRGQDGVAVPVPIAPGAFEKCAGKPVRIRFDLFNAQLFGFRVE